MGGRSGLIAAAPRLGILSPAATSPPGSECPVQVERCADEGKVREGVGEVAQGLTSGHDLPRVKPQVVRAHARFVDHPDQVPLWGKRRAWMGDGLGLTATARGLGIFWTAAASPAGSERPVEVECRADHTGKV